MSRAYQCFLFTCIAILAGIVTVFAHPASAQAQASYTCYVNNLTYTSGAIQYRVTVTAPTGFEGQNFTLAREIRRSDGSVVQQINVPGMSPCGQATCTYNQSFNVAGVGIQDPENLSDYTMSFSFTDGGGCGGPLNVTVPGANNPGTGDDTNQPTNEGGDYKLLNGPSANDLNALNPLRRPDANSAIADQFATPAGLISRVLLFAFPIAGILMLLMLVWGGFEILSGATNKKSLDSGKNRIKAGIAGFMLLFTSYWIVQVIEVVLGIQIF